MRLFNLEIMISLTITNFD